MQRLSAQDLMMLRGDDFGWPQEIGVLAILDAGLLRPDGTLPMNELRERIGGRLPMLPRLRQVPYRPRFGLGPPLWVDVDKVDLAAHVHCEPMPACTAESEVLPTVQRLWNKRLDRHRPLWRMWFLPGMPHGRVALLLKVHHAIADGTASMALLHTLLGEEPGTAPMAPAPAPRTADLVLDALARGRRAAAGILTGMRRPAALLRATHNTWTVLRPYLTGPRMARTSLNRPIGNERLLSAVSADLDTLRRTAHAHDATINDVLLAAVTGGLRDLLIHRGENPDVILRAHVPISRHHIGAGQPRGNQLATMEVPLPVGEPDPVHALRLIAASAVKHKKSATSGQLPLLHNPLFQKIVWRSMANQRVTCLTVTNVRGPAHTLRLQGAALREMMPIFTIFANYTLGVAALSYAGRLTITIVADKQTCPDVETFTSGIRARLHSLADAHEQT